MICHILLILRLLNFACAATSTITPKSSVTDAELESAVSQARGSLDTSITKLAAPHADRTFVAVKVRCSPPGGYTIRLAVQRMSPEERE